MAFPNLFEEFVAAQLTEIRQTQNEILAKLCLANHSKDQTDLVDIQDAAKLVFLSKGGFYNMHKKYFTQYGAGRKRLFSRKELEAYNRGELKPVENTRQKGAEEFRVKRLSKKNQLRVAL